MQLLVIGTMQQAQAGAVLLSFDLLPDIGFK